MITTTSLIKVETPFAYYSVPIRLHCPYCKVSTKRTRTYRTLKSLHQHIVVEHKTDGSYPFTLDEARDILKNIAKAIQWKILV